MKKIIVTTLVIVILFLSACGGTTTTPEAEVPPSDDTALPSETTPTAAPIERQTYTLKTSVFPSNSGSVSPSGGEYKSNTQLTLTATPADGYTFDYWGGDVVIDSSPTTTIVMDSNKSLIAHFTDMPKAIPDIFISSITESEAFIQYSSTIEGYSQIEYGTSEKYGKTSSENNGIPQSNGKTWYRQNLNGLVPESLYHFRILLIGKDGTEFLSNDYTFATKNAKELVSVVLYPVKTTSTKGRITHLGSTLFNDSSQVMTVYRMEIISDELQIQYAISESGHYGEEATIAETWGSGLVEAGHSLSVACYVYEPPLREYLRDWQVKWYCLDANGSEFTITAEYSSLF